MDAVEDIKQRLAIEDVLSEYVQLKRAGRNFKGLSPFTSEKSPSFVVSPEKQIWHDFSSNKGGDMFSFIMEVEGLDFKGALELLARKAGIDLEQYQGSSKQHDGQKERLYGLLELATKFYQEHFKRSQLAIEYVSKQRQFSRETATTWRLGYAPNNGRALVEFASGRGYTPKELQLAGLTNRYGGDLFKGRLMIPLADANGRIIGFTARILEDDPKAPKYLNTPATALYDKSRHVFGLHLAKEAMRKSGFVVLAEGNLDVIASHQAGIRQCVATAGTALTEMQLKTLGRFTPDVRLSFDADRAGIAATERAIPIAAKVGVNLSVVTVPSGKDPDELIRTDKKLWEQVITKPQYVVDWLIEKYRGELDLTTSLGKRDFTDAVFTVIRRLEDRVQQEHYVQVVADIIGVSGDALRTKLDAPAASEPRLKTPKMQSQDAPVHVDAVRAQNRLLALLLLQPKLRDMLTDLSPTYLIDGDASTLLTFLIGNPDFDGDARQAAELQPIANYVKIATLQYEELYQGLELLELRYEAERLLTQLVEHYVKRQKQEISAALQQSGDQDTTTLLTQAKELDTLLKKYKGGA